MNDVVPGRLQRVANLTEFFRDSLRQAMERQHFEVADHTEHYLVSLLTLFARSEALFENTDEGLRLRPLALLLAEAAAAPDVAHRARALQRLGDVSLFIAGFFAHSFARRLVDVDYHIAMGGRAYGSLSGMSRNTARGRALTQVFEELALKSDAETLRLYEIWLKTGSPRARARLAELGVAPVPVDLRGTH
jgi:hypothetical protein